MLEHRLTRAEPSPVERGGAPLVGEPNCRFEEALAEELMRVAEQALGRRVLAHRTQVIPASGVRFEMLNLAGPAEGSRARQLLRTERS